MIFKDIYYLATPYLDPSFALREQRFRSVTKFASILIAGGLRVYSPITHSHPMCDHKTGNHILDHAGWLEFDTPFMSLCTRLIVLCLPGWSCSKGVKQEIGLMHDMDRKPVVYIVPYNLDDYPEKKDQQFRVAASNQDQHIRFEIIAAIHQGLHAEPVYPFGRRYPKPKLTTATENLAKSVNIFDILGDMFGSDPFHQVR